MLQPQHYDGCKEGGVISFIFPVLFCRMKRPRMQQNFKVTNVFMGYSTSQVYHNNANLKPEFNFMHVLIINEDILGAFGALHV